LKLIREAHTSKVAGNFGVGKTIANLQRYVYWTRMKKYVAKYIRGCILFCTNKPNNRKQCLYHSLHVPNRPWEIIYMDFVGGLQPTRRGHDYLFVVVDRFNKMCILTPCKNTIKRKEATNKFFVQVWVKFGIPRSIISNKDTIFLSSFWTTLWEKMDTKLNRYTTFYPQTDMEVVDMTLVQLLRGYN
jgi:hypothetical protein